MHQRKAIYTLFIFIQSLIYGIGNPATKVAYKSITPLWLLAARFTLAFLLFLLLFGRRILPCIKKCLRHFNPLTPIHGGIRSFFLSCFPS